MVDCSMSGRWLGCVIVSGLMIALLSLRAFAGGGNERTEYKQGISLIIHGQPGVDYAFERFYHDPMIDDHGVIYIRGDVQISLAYNENHRRCGGEIIGIPKPGEPGILRYKVDLDWNRRYRWSDGRTVGEVPEDRRAPRYEGPFTFAQLTYFDGKPVLGRIGPNRPIPPYPNRSDPDFYFAGLRDDFGDEWHILTVASDDSHESLHYRHWASDGRIHQFVVNPRTPLISFHAAAPASQRPQWYTTPAKTYWVPKIHRQTTYVTPGIEMQFSNITNDQPVMWRIDEIHGDTWQTYANPVALDSLNLTGNTVYTIRYRIGTDGPEKTRTLHYNPSFPSDSEPRPSRVLFADEAMLQRVRRQISEGEVHPKAYESIKSRIKQSIAGKTEADLKTGTRLVTAGDGPLNAAFIITMEGLDKHLDLARFARVRMLDNELVLDPVGDEDSHNTSNPARELNTHGYYFVRTPMAVALAYDLLIDRFRYPQYPDGFTAIEDYRIRDNLGMFALSTMQRKWDGWPNRGPASARSAADMWMTAREVGLMIVAMVMPEYDTPYYGTSGAAGKRATHRWAPYPDLALTWWESVNSEELGAGYYYMVTNEPTPRWRDRPPYWSGQLTGWLLYVMSNARANYDGQRFDHLERAYQLAMDGTLKVSKQAGRDKDHIHHYTALVINEHFPNLAEQAEAALRAGSKDQPAPGDKSLDYAVWYHGVYSLVYCRLDWREHAKPVQAQGN